MLERISLVAIFVVSSSTAVAATAQVPESSSAALFAIGALGVIVGRRLSMGRGSGDD